jgi:hypothetical protein
VTTTHADLDTGQLVVLEEACRLADRQDQLHEAVERDGVVSAAARAKRLGAVELARLLAALRLPGKDGRRPQQRPMRGVHAVACSPVSSLERMRQRSSVGDAS